MNLVIDIGNTRTKLAVFKGDRPIYQISVEELTQSCLDSLAQSYPDVNASIVSSTKGSQSSLVRLLQQRYTLVFELDHTTPLPIANGYETPETLGKDRLASAVGANKIYPNENVLVIDAGTAITYDFIDETNTYRGGYITPGLRMRFEALNHFTSKLPLVEPGAPQCCEGTNTINAIRGGVELGLEGELNAVIHHFSDRCKNLRIILTGGDTNYFECLLKNYNFATLETTILGLNTILEYNQQQ